MRNDRQNYGVVAKTFHWVIAVAILALLAMGYIMSDVLGRTPLSVTMHGVHKSLGVLVCLLALARLGWRFYSPPPDLPEPMGRAERLAAHASHGSLYVLMIGVPLIGILMSQSAGYPVSVFGWYTLPPLIAPDRPLAGILRAAHGYAAYILLGLVVLHAAAAFAHFFFYRDRVLQRMLPFGRGDA